MLNLCVTLSLLAECMLRLLHLLLYSPLEPSFLPRKSCCFLMKKLWRYQKSQFSPLKLGTDSWARLVHLCQYFSLSLLQDVLLQTQILYRTTFDTALLVLCLRKCKIKKVLRNSNSRMFRSKSGMECSHLKRTVVVLLNELLYCFRNNGNCFTSFFLFNTLCIYWYNGNSLAWGFSRFIFCEAFRIL